MVKVIKTLLESVDWAFTAFGCWLLISTLFHVPATLVMDGQPLSPPLWVISSAIGLLGTIIIFPRIYRREDEDGSKIIKF